MKLFASSFLNRSLNRPVDEALSPDGGAAPEGGLSRKMFLQASLVTGLVGLVGCSDDGAGDGGSDADSMSGDGDGDGTGGNVSGDGDGDGDGTGGNTQGTGGNNGTGGDDGTGGEQGGETCDEDFTITSSMTTGGGGHSHTLTITAAFLNAGIAGTVTSSLGAGDHSHCVTLSVEDINTIKSGGVVTKFTCNGGNHEFVISCAAGAPAPAQPTMCGGDEDTRGQAGECN